MNKMNKINHQNYFITNKSIPYKTKINYLITIPCVNREERNAINIIDKTFKVFEDAGILEDSDSYTLKIILFESGSNDLSYLSCLNAYIAKYPGKIEIMFSKTKLNGVTNTFRMFQTINSIQMNNNNNNNNTKIDFIIWMDDDILVCKNFMKNADTWIKNYANFSLFSSLYVPYDSFFINDRKYVNNANLPGFYGTCCTIFKPKLAEYVIPYWFDEHFERFSYNPDTRFRDSLRKTFSNKKILVSFPSLVEHLNIGSAILQNKDINKGHKAKLFVGVEKDPELYVKDIYQNLI
jgi:hypothetical protein